MKKAFKMACLAYEPSYVTFYDEYVPREELLDRRSRIMQKQKLMVSMLEKKDQDDFMNEGTEAVAEEISKPTIINEEKKKPLAKVRMPV